LKLNLIDPSPAPQESNARLHKWVGLKLTVFFSRNRAAFIFTVVTLLCLFGIPSQTTAVVFWPVFYVCSHLPFWGISPALGETAVLSLAYFTRVLLFSFFYALAVWLFILWAWRHSSTGCKLALGTCIPAAFVFWRGLAAYQERIDWTSRGLNPGRPGFKPAVVLLAGTLDYESTDLADQRHSGTALFEIWMRGADYYFADRWHGSYSKYGSWDAVTVVLPNFEGNRHSGYSGRGRRGGSGQSSGSTSNSLPGQSMWRGSEFIGGAVPNSPLGPGGNVVFSEPKVFGPYQIPQRIEWRQGSRREVLHVRRVEFHNEPGTNWFLATKRKYFGDKEGPPQRVQSLLEDAGWSGKKN
jgi:hypothetical protein